MGRSSECAGQAMYCYMIFLLRTLFDPEDNIQRGHIRGGFASSRHPSRCPGRGGDGAMDFTLSHPLQTKLFVLLMIVVVMGNLFRLGFGVVVVVVLVVVIKDCNFHVIVVRDVPRVWCWMPGGSVATWVYPHSEPFAKGCNELGLAGAKGVWNTNGRAVIGFAASVPKNLESNE